MANCGFNHLPACGVWRSTCGIVPCLCIWRPFGFRDRLTGLGKPEAGKCRGVVAESIMFFVFLKTYQGLLCAHLPYSGVCFLRVLFKGWCQGISKEQHDSRVKPKPWASPESDAMIERLAGQKMGACVAKSGVVEHGVARSALARCCLHALHPPESRKANILGLLQIASGFPANPVVFRKSHGPSLPSPMPNAHTPQRICLQIRYGSLVCLALVSFGFSLQPQEG